MSNHTVLFEFNENPLTMCFDIYTAVFMLAKSTSGNESSAAFVMMIFVQKILHENKIRE